MTLDLQQINAWGALAGAFASFAIGGLWFSPVLFGKAWSESIGKRREDLGSPAIAMGLFLLTAVIRVFLIAILFQFAGLDTTGKGFMGGLVVAGIVFFTSLSNAGFTGTIKTKWWWIQASYEIVGVLVMAGIVGASSPERPLTQVQEAVDNVGQTVEDGLKDLGVK
jgi:hypothetical protein